VVSPKDSVKSLEIYEKSNLGIFNLDGLNPIDLTKKWETPLFVYSASRIRENYKLLSNSIKSQYPNSKVLYACKANGLLSILSLLREEGSGIDVVSEGELYLAKLAGFSNESIFFNGNGKSDQEIRLALSQNIILNVDSLHEIETIIEHAKELNCQANVCLRVTPDVHSRTIEEFATGIPESKFGLEIRTGEALDAVNEISKHKEIRLRGLHCHIGSQITTIEPYRFAIESIIDFGAELGGKYNNKLEIINIGGGFGIPQEGIEIVPPLDVFGLELGSYFSETTKRFGLQNICLMIEPGASIVGTSGTVLLKVISIKQRKNGITWVSVDGGADILLRATQGWYKFPIVYAGKPNDIKKVKANVVGPLCYSGDVIAYDVELPVVNKGDILAVLNAGAYTFCLLNNYNARIAPAAIMIENGCDRLISRRGEFADLVQRER